MTIFIDIHALTFFMVIILSIARVNISRPDDLGCGSSAFCVKLDRVLAYTQRIVNEGNFRIIGN